MTKKDYVQFAKLIADLRSHHRNDFDPSGHRVVPLHAIEEGAIRIFTDDNPRFDAARFRAACVGPIGSR